MMESIESIWNKFGKLKGRRKLFNRKPMDASEIQVPAHLVNEMVEKAVYEQYKDKIQILPNLV